jgi:DNA-binding HxlR family transcriptional regulator
MVHARAELVQKFRTDADQTIPVEVVLELVGGRWSITSFSRK